MWLQVCPCLLCTKEQEVWMNYVLFLWYVAHSISFFHLVHNVDTWRSTRTWLAQGSNTHTSENAAFSNLPPQTPSAEVSSRPSSPLIDVLKAKSWPDNRSKWDSTSTFEQTSVNISTVISITPLCRIAGKPPVGQDKKCSTENVVLQTQWEGTSFSGQLYRKHNASLNAALLRQKPCSSKGNVVSHFDAPLWLASSNALEYGELTRDCTHLTQHLSFFRHRSFSFCISVDANFCLLATPYKPLTLDKNFSTRSLQSLRNINRFKWISSKKNFLMHISRECISVEKKLILMEEKLSIIDCFLKTFFVINQKRN